MNVRENENENILYLLYLLLYYIPTIYTTLLYIYCIYYSIIYLLYLLYIISTIYTTLLYLYYISTVSTSLLYIYFIYYSTIYLLYRLLYYISTIYLLCIYCIDYSTIYLLYIYYIYYFTIYLLYLLLYYISTIYLLLNIQYLEMKSKDLLNGVDPSWILESQNLRYSKLSNFGWNEHISKKWGEGGADIKKWVYQFNFLINNSLNTRAPHMIFPNLIGKLSTFK